MFKPFVGVSVAEIQSTWDPKYRRFVPTNLNPADDLSQGISLEDSNGRWKNGPQFLNGPKEEWPIKSVCQSMEDNPEKKKTKIMAPLSNQRPLIDPLHYSSWQKLARVTVYVLRFVHNVKSSHSDPRNSRVGPLQPEEISAAETFWIARAHRDLADWRDCFNDLAPFMDGTIIRVGGRQKKSQLDYDQKYPVLLSSTNHISQLIMEDVYHKVSHVGPERTLSESR